MKVLVLSQIYPSVLEPSLGLFVHDQVKELAKCCEVVVVSPTPLSPPVLCRLKARWARYAARPDRTILEGIEVHYPRYMNIPGKRGFPLVPFSYEWALRGPIARLKKGFDFDLIHAHTICPDGLAAAWLGRRVGVPVVCTIHGSDINVYPRRTKLTRIITQWAIRSVDVIITVSDALRERTLALETPKQEIRVIPNGVDLRKFTPIDRQQARAELGLPQDGKILLYASRLDKAKGLSYLLLAFKTVKERRGDCLLALAGAGPYRRHLEQETAELGLQGDVLFAGLRPHTEIAKWMSACDLVVQPSLNEGSPLPIYEALACGRPMIASRVGGIPELISSEKLGLLVPAEDPEALSEAVLCGFDREWDSEYIRGRGKRYTWGHVADQLTSLYERVLAHRDASCVSYAGLHTQAEGSP